MNWLYISAWVNENQSMPNKWEQYFHIILRLCFLVAEERSWKYTVPEYSKATYSLRFCEFVFTFDCLLWRNSSFWQVNITYWGKPFWKRQPLCQLSLTASREAHKEQTLAQDFSPCLHYPYMLLEKVTKPNLNDFDQIIIHISVLNYSFNCKYLQ